MRRVLFLLISLATLASAQQYFWHLGGRVVDDKGRPIEGAFFDNTGMEEEEYAERFTNREGIFDIWARSPLIVLRKAGYASVIIHPEDTNKREFTMRSARTPFPVCGGSPSSSKQADPLGSSFKFRPTNRVTLLKKGNDVDYSFERYGIKADDHAASILVGKGLGGWSTPVDQDVWSSAQYSEQTFTVRGIDVIDVRGETKEGKHWRFVGRFTQSATYRDADPATAKLLDEFLDRTCLDLRP